MQDSGISESGDNMEKKYVTKLLRQQGFKVTPQRIAVYSVLANSKEHPNAEMIYNQLKPMYPTMSLATVYKTVEILRQIGLVQFLNAGEDSFRYDARVDAHSHVQCTECKRVDDIEIEETSLLKNIDASTEYKLTKHQFYFYGISPGCQQTQLNKCV